MFDIVLLSRAAAKAAVFCFVNKCVSFWINKNFEVLTVRGYALIVKTAVRLGARTEKYEYY